MARAVRFSSFGGPEVLEVVDIPIPEAGPGEVVVEVFASGISPVESAVRSGTNAERWPVEFPSGQGREFAGVVHAVGPGVTTVKRGAEVMGYLARGAQATHIAVPATQLLPKPHSLAWEVAGSLYVAGTTALGAVEGLNLGPGDVVVITAAAGGIGCLAAQLAKLRGATVVGSTAEQRFDFLRQFGVLPVSYGADLSDEVRAAVQGRPVSAFLDFLGGTSDEAAQLGVPPTRVFTTTDWGAVEDNEAVKLYAGDTQALARIAKLVEDRQIRLPIADVFPLDDVQEAYRVLSQRDAAGKIVLGMKLVEYKGQVVRQAKQKQQDLTIGVPTPHDKIESQPILPPVIGDAAIRRAGGTNGNGANGNGANGDGSGATTGSVPATRPDATAAETADTGAPTPPAER